MKKRSPKRSIRAGKTRRSSSPQTETYHVVVRSWMLVIVFAVMLGVGAIVGTFLNQKLNESTPTVAGVQSESR